MTPYPQDRTCGPVTTTCCTPLRIFASGCMDASSGCVPPSGRGKGKGHKARRR
nr:MAG TPA: hypothetical protein [Caudoviricetes sp.]